MTYFREFNETSSRQTDYDFVEYLLDETGNTIDSNTNELGMEPTYSDREDYVRVNFGVGWQEVNTLHQLLEDYGVTIDENLKALFDAREDDPLIVVHGDTIEELVEKLDMDPDVLQATYDRYQSFCESGVDED